MILEKVKKTSAFLDFFQEADDDETPKRNQKVIKVRAPGGRRTDFTQGADLADDEAEEPVPEEPATDDTDFTDNSGGEDTGDVGNDADTAVDTIKEVIKLGKNYNSFLDKKDGKESSVTFIYKTAELTK